MFGPQFSFTVKYVKCLRAAGATPHPLGYPHLLLLMGHTWTVFVLPQQKCVSVHII